MAKYLSIHDTILILTFELCARGKTYKTPAIYLIQRVTRLKGR